MDIFFFVLPLVVVAAGYLLPARTGLNGTDPSEARRAPCFME